MPTQIPTIPPVVARRAAIYCRISKDDGGAGLGVERQQKDCVEYASRHGLTVVDVFVDNELSASRYAMRARPAFNRMLDAARTGEVTTVIVWALDRLSRQPRELEALIDLADSGTEVHTVSGQLDLTAPEGRLVARILMAASASESDQASKRIRREKLARADAGLNHGGSRAFAFERDGRTHRQSEVPILREMAERVLSGESLNAVARWLNEIGAAPSQRAKHWSGTTVRTVLANPRIAGYRSSNGELVGRAVWEPIVDDLTWRRLDRHFKDKKRTQPPKRRTLLTGFVTCGLCGGTLNRRWRSGLPVLVCQRAPGRVNCGRIHASSDRVEELVVEAALAAADGPLLADRHARRQEEANAVSGSTVLAELTEVDRRLRDLAEMFAAGEIERMEWSAARQPLNAKKDELESQLALNAESNALGRLNSMPGALRRAWTNGMTLDQRRSALGLLIERVVVNPSSRRGCRFDSDRVVIEWRV
jgi:site-specific DNA recombinase